MGIGAMGIGAMGMAALTRALKTAIGHNSLHPTDFPRYPTTTFGKKSGARYAPVLGVQFVVGKRLALPERKMDVSNWENVGMLIDETDLCIAVFRCACVFRFLRACFHKATRPFVSASESTGGFAVSLRVSLKTY